MQKQVKQLKIESDKDLNSIHSKASVSKDELCNRSVSKEKRSVSKEIKRDRSASKEKKIESKQESK